MTKYFNRNKIQFEGKKTENLFAFRHYNPQEEINGQSMKGHLRFALAYWHVMTQDGSDPFGAPVNIRNWEGNTPLETAKNRVHAFFELLDILDVDYFCFHDVDIAPEGESLEEFFENLDIITDLIKEKMDETGKKLLWNTANMFTHPRYVNGAATTNDLKVYAHAAAQVKKGLEISKKLGGENYVFWGGREGYESLLNTDLVLEQDNLANFYKMALDYTKTLDHKVQFLIEPKPKEPTTHQYDFDAATAMAFLYKYDLQDDFKLNLEANHATLAGHTFEHEIAVANSFNALGSLDANQGHPLLGWDTDEFPTNVLDVTLAMLEVLNKEGGLAPGGINFDAKVRRSSFEMDDLILSHIAGMDTFARGFKNALRIKEEKYLSSIKDKRYQSFNEGYGKEVRDGKASLERLSQYAFDHQDVEMTSDHLEIVKSILNDYLD